MLIINKFSVPNSMSREADVLPYYQPICHKLSGLIKNANGVEVLMRTLDITGSMHMPSEFMADLISNDLLTEASTQLINKVRADYLKCHHKLKPGFYYSFNVTLEQLNNTNYMSAAVDFLALLNLNGHEFVFELLECESITRESEGIALIQHLHLEGFKFSIDDFGAGFSRIDYLYKMPISYVKLDKSLIDDILSNPGGSVVIKGLAKIIHRCGMSIIAEGVENAEQYRSLLKSGVDNFQGFYFSRPKPYRRIDW